VEMKRSVAFETVGVRVCEIGPVVEVAVVNAESVVLVGVVVFVVFGVEVQSDLETRHGDDVSQETEHRFE
jgi:uncharacterized membrane protein YhaH (DUF805 family)